MERRCDIGATAIAEAELQRAARITPTAANVAMPMMSSSWRDLLEECRLVYFVT